MYVDGCMCVYSWLLPEGQYGIYQMKGNDIYITSERSALSECDVWECVYVQDATCDCSIVARVYGY